MLYNPTQKDRKDGSLIMRYGLVMEGGAMRGLFTAGVIDVLMENDIRFDGAVGVSAGAAIGCNIKSRQIGRAIRYNTRFSKEWHYRSYRSLLLTGDLYGADFCYHKIPEELDLFDTDTFENNPMEFYAVCTDVESGKAHYQPLTDGRRGDCEWIRASASMPLASRIVNIDGHKYLDGGISDSIPLQFMEEKGYERNVVILTQPQGYVKKPYKIMPVLKASLHKYPNMIEAIRKRYIMYNSEISYIAEREAAGSAFVIRPPEALGIGPLEHDPEQMRRVYSLGRDEGVRALDGIRQFLKT